MKSEDGNKEVKFNPLAIAKENPKTAITLGVVLLVILIAFLTH